jgi:beta-galactosidase
MIFKAISRTAILALCIYCAPVQAADGKPVSMPAGFAGEWRAYQRAEIKTTTDTVTVSNGFVASADHFKDAQIVIRMRAPESAKEVQAWAGFRVVDQDRRYVVGLRGGNNNQIYLARYAPDANDEFLGIAPLDFSPQVGTWYSLRILTLGDHIQIYLNDEKLPRINVIDTRALWIEGAIAVGGGYLPSEFASVKVLPLSEELQKQFIAVGKKAWMAPVENKEAKRIAQRASYKPQVIAELKAGRSEISLNGNWLFLPEYQTQNGGDYKTLAMNDTQWHVLDVPNFWTPMLPWLHGEGGLNKLNGVSGQKGVSDNVYLLEMKRLTGYTFDWEKTDGGWYRHYIDLPSDLASRKFELCFDAIAKISEVWVNGIHVGSHVGMFGEIRLDISKAVVAGRNVIAVQVKRNVCKASKASNKIVGIAESVEVTESMLSSLPVDMFNFDPAGIWQPVKLVVTAPVAVSDVYIQPSLDGAKIEVQLSNSGSQESTVTLGYRVHSVADGSELVAGHSGLTVVLPAGGHKDLNIDLPKVAPQLWSPQTPNLYELELIVLQNGRELDRHATRFGFRTFTVSGNQLLLNGRPYWLRGGNHFPIGIKPNDATLADTFIKLAKAGNVEMTRTHVAPLTKTWAEASDRLGMMISFEGIWPWLMLNGDVPNSVLLNAWKDDFTNIVRKYRNHPSVVMWTVNNEMKFYIFDREKPDLLKRKWAVASDMVKTLRQIDPTRPVVVDSGYTRKENKKQYDEILKPNGFDDGDIDDAHRYFNWYNPSFMSLYQGQYGVNLASPDRPLISQEMSTGYPRNDDGLPTRAYLFRHQTPQALVGKYAYEHNDPAYFLKRQAFLTQQLAEVVRRTNHDRTAGVLHFAYLTWFKDVYDAKAIRPWPTYYSLKSALSPVLVSAELFGWHYYAGATFTPRVCIVNDATDGQATPAGQLEWRIESAGELLAKGGKTVSSVPYYQTQWHDLEIQLPSKLPAARSEATLKVSLSVEGRVLTENSYDLSLAEKTWSQSNRAISPSEIAIYDPSHDLPAAMLPAAATQLNSLSDLSPLSNTLLIVARANKLDDNALMQVKKHALAGGRVLLLHGGLNIPKLLPDAVKSYRRVAGEMVTLNRPESPVFDGLEPLDLCWFPVVPGKRAYACEGVYSLDRSFKNVVELASFCEIHAYLKKPDDVLAYTGAPLIEASVGEGIIIASEMMISAGITDPIANRLFNNLIVYLTKSKAVK